MNSNPHDNARIQKLLDMISARLTRHGQDRLIITYDGSVQDKILFALIEAKSGESKTQENIEEKIEELIVICCTRPCMDQVLQQEVRDFAQEHGFFLFETAGDCEIEENSYIIKHHRCGDIATPLKSAFDGGGLHVISTISNANHAADMNAASRNFYGFDLSEDDVDGGAYWTINGVTNLLLFHSLLPQDILDIYVFLFKEDARSYQVPVCFAPCYYEAEKLKLLNLIGGDHR